MTTASSGSGGVSGEEALGPRWMRRLDVSGALAYGLKARPWGGRLSGGFFRERRDVGGGDGGGTEAPSEAKVMSWSAVARWSVVFTLFRLLLLLLSLSSLLSAPVLPPTTASRRRRRRIGGGCSRQWELEVVEWVGDEMADLDEKLVRSSASLLPSVFPLFLLFYVFSLFFVL
jgi:hypothetical protein